MNYIRHLNAFDEHTGLHPEWDSYHISMYYALFHIWNRKKFRPLLKVGRAALMQASRIGSMKKYYQCLKELHRSGMIIYYPAKGVKQLATISMIELFAPKEKTTNSFCKSDDDVALEVAETGALDEGDGCIINNTDSVSHIAQACTVYNTDGILHIAQGCAINNTDSVSSVTQPDGINATGSVPHIAHSLKEKTINDLKRERVNGHSPMGNNNFSFFSSPDTACFPPGSLQEVKDFFLQQGYPLLEATNFFDYYAVTGWKTRGGAPVVNWQCAARRWMHTATSQQRIAINTFKHAKDQHLHTSDDKDYSEPL